MSIKMHTEEDFKGVVASYQTRVTGRCIDAVIKALKNGPVEVHGCTHGVGSKAELWLRIRGLNIRHTDPKNFSNTEKDWAKQLVSLATVIEGVLANTPPADGDARFLIPCRPANKSEPYLIDYNGSKVSYHAVSMSVGPDYGHSYTTIEAIYHMACVRKLNDIEYRIQRYECPMEQFGQARAIGEPKIVEATDKAIEVALGQAKPTREDNSPFFQYRRTLNQMTKGMAAELEPQRFKLQGHDLVCRIPAEAPFPDRGSCHQTIDSYPFYVCERRIGSDFAQVFSLVEIRLDEQQPTTGAYTGRLEVKKYNNNLWRGPQFRGQEEFEITDLNSVIGFCYGISGSGPFPDYAELAFQKLRDDIHTFARHLKLRPLREVGFASKLAAQLAQVG